MKTEFSCKFFLYLDSVFRNTDKLVQNPALIIRLVVSIFLIPIKQRPPILIGEQ